MLLSLLGEEMEYHLSRLKDVHSAQWGGAAEAGMAEAVEAGLLLRMRSLYPVHRSPRLILKRAAEAGERQEVNVAQIGGVGAGTQDSQSSQVNPFIILLSFRNSICAL